MSDVAEMCPRCRGFVWHRRWPCECKPTLVETTGSGWLADVGNRLRAVRNSQGLSLDALALRAGMSKTGLWEIEAGKHEPMARTLVALSRALGVSVDYLLLLRVE